MTVEVAKHKRGACRACQGAHRAHTCGGRGNREKAVVATPTPAVQTEDVTMRSIPIADLCEVIDEDLAALLPQLAGVSGMLPEVQQALDDFESSEGSSELSSEPDETEPVSSVPSPPDSDNGMEHTGSGASTSSESSPPPPEKLVTVEAVPAAPLAVVAHEATCEIREATRIVRAMNLASAGTTSAPAPDWAHAKLSLAAAFRNNEWPSDEEKQRLCLETGMDVDALGAWFENRRRLEDAVRKNPAATKADLNMLVQLQPVNLQRVEQSYPMIEHQPSSHDERRKPKGFTCRFPGCDQFYASTDGVRKHCRKKHPQWLAKIKPFKGGVTASFARAVAAGTLTAGTLTLAE